MVSKKSTPPVKKSRRSRFKYPAVESSVNLITRKEEIEDVKSYFHKLSPEEKEWMNSFVEEEVCANFNHKGTKINKTKKDRKKIYDKNNARNRCIYTREKAQDKLKFMENLNDLEKN
jgi:hypothetical protein